MRCKHQFTGKCSTSVKTSCQQLWVNRCLTWHSISVQFQGVCYSPLFRGTDITFSHDCTSSLEMDVTKKNNIHHPSQQYSLAVFKDVTVQTHNLILFNVKLYSMFNIFTDLIAFIILKRILHYTIWTHTESPARHSGNKLLPNSATWYGLQTTPSMMLSLFEKSRTENNLMFWSVRYSKSEDNGQHWGSEVYILQCFHSPLVTMWP